jgi:hypothetical protein
MTSKPLKKLFAKKQFADIAEWYTEAEIVEKFGVSKHGGVLQSMLT